MSASRLRLTVSRPARRDFQAAVVYSGRQWGQEQRRRYRESINRALEALRAHPELGRRRDDVFPGCRTLPVGQHLICYRVEVTEVIIDRILHGRQDVTAAEFDLPAPESDR